MASLGQIELVGIVENGVIRLPAPVRLPEGVRVKVIVNGTTEADRPLEPEPLDSVEVEADLSWADGRRFPQ
ncbi:MAG: hypothetical protein HY744_27230 [Deltaproteobacteria bacterium]|nr:hypothetical protein [Deltaproteobacteria bacterium]